MDNPLELSFHNMEPSDALKARVQDSLVRLEQHFGRVISCRVTISLPHKSQKAVGNQPDVRVVLRVPGKEVVVSRKMNHNGHKKADNDPYAVVDEAFVTAQQQLKDWQRTNQTEARQAEARQKSAVVN